MTSLPSSPAPGTVLLCIDMQPAFLKAVPDGARVLQRCRFAVAAARGLEVPVLFTEQAPTKLGPVAPDLLELAEPPEVLSKDEFSALANAAIRARLLAGDSGRLLLCGIETPVCVFQTARDALAAGLSVTLLADCLGGRRPDDGATALAQLARIGAEILPSETVFYALLGSARHPFFRAYTQLVKANS